MASTILKGDTGDWELVIGLEVHAQVISQSKLFSGASAAFGGAPNAHVSLVDAAMPGMLPVINEECVHQAVRTGFGLNAQINRYSVFDRKNYFYADLPQGYQISQYKQPIIGEGWIDIEPEENGKPTGEVRRIGIERLHLEQDAGKSMHDQHPSKSYIDLNRSGVALMEIVSKPEMRSAEEAGAYIKKLRTIVRYLGTCDGNMEEGSLRCDVNLSVRPVGEEKLGIRTETKNVNSVRNVMLAIEYEARRQIEELEAGRAIVQETRLWDPGRGETRSMRSKEEAHDYRYFPDPDLLPLKLTEALIGELEAALPELPDAKRARFIDQYGLSTYDAAVLAAERARADYFEAVAAGRDAKLATNWVIVELLGALNKADKDIDDSPVSAKALGELVGLIADNTISGRIAKDVFAAMVDTGESPAEIVEAKGLKQVTDTGAIEAMIDEVLAKNEDKVTQYRSGKDKLFGFFVGQVMKASGGKANPGAVNEILKAKLQG